MTSLEFFYDISSPWTYLAFSRIEALAQRHDVDIDWKPILVGGVFNAVNQSVYDMRANPNPVKQQYYKKDIADWARYCGIKIGNPPVFPVRSVEIMRTAIVALDAGCLPAYSWAAFRAYWEYLRDISLPEERALLCRSVGLDPEEVEKKISQSDVKDRLRNNTEDLIARGGFGSPTIFINRTLMFFGNDRLPLVEAELERLAGVSQ